MKQYNMIININKKAAELKLNTPDLMTRHVGRVMYNSIRNMVKKMSDGETMLLDFGGIKVIDSSFIDEIIVKLILDSRESESVFYIKLKNISEIAEINIDLVFRSYSNYKNKKIVVISENICHNNTFFIGPLSDRERDVIDFVRVNKTVTENDIVRFSGHSADQVASLMKELHALRVIKKLSDGAYNWI
jgi:hypothetical protein